jgi:hypothetical protein
MRSMNRIIPLIFVLVLTASSIIMVKPAWAQTKPSVPSFTLKYVDLSYNIPPTYGTDQYTGKTVVTEEGYYVDNRSLQFTIKNQLFTPITDPSGNQTGLYYNFRIKGAYGTQWDYYPFAANGVTTSRYGGMFGGNNTESPADLAQSNSEYTTITIQIPGVYRVPAEAQLEVQAQALVGYMVPSDYMMAGHVYVFTGQYGDWSNTQTITIGESTPTVTQTTLPSQSTSTQTASTAPFTLSPSPFVSPSPFATQQTQPEPTQTNPLPYVLVTFAAVIIAFVAGVLVTLWRKKPNANQSVI